MNQPSDVETTANLLTRIRSGDDLAREQLVVRFLPILRRWARGRLPVQSRALADTDDLVQVSLIRALEKVGTFKASREGDFLAYLRQIMLNAVRDEIRRPANRPRHRPDESLPDPERCILEQAIGHDMLDAYETALADLTEAQQHAVMLRVEFGYSHAEVSDALGLASADAARMLAARGVMKLADALREHRPS